MPSGRDRRPVGTRFHARYARNHVCRPGHRPIGAPGWRRRILVCDVAREDEPPRPLKLINPEIVWASDEIKLAEEGCLSLPDHFAEVERPSAVRISYLDENGEPQELEADELLAACVQHEMDHLEGILFVDYLSPLKRNIILRKMRKLKRQKEAA